MIKAAMINHMNFCHLLKVAAGFLWKKLEKQAYIITVDKITLPAPSERYVTGCKILSLEAVDCCVVSPGKFSPLIGPPPNSSMPSGGVGGSQLASLSSFSVQFISGISPISFCPVDILPFVLAFSPLGFASGVVLAVLSVSAARFAIISVSSSSIFSPLWFYYKKETLKTN